MSAATADFQRIDVVEKGDTKGQRLEWSNLTYSVGVKKDKDVFERKTLLHNMSGEALPGEVKINSIFYNIVV
jgi:hypothetical protein